ncbi:MAG TPA: aminotransferase class I/II-fold pyridoxal phosphate-dependent enzyme [Anaerolineales bacterium]|nr:aminotransferase class I/II-fold pyridoxal phosphate-dependent enzyme [Anaerolineales bacterium]
MTTTSHPKLKPAERMANLPPYFFHSLNLKIARLRAAGLDVIRMDMGSPDLPPAPFIIEALKRSAENHAHHGYMPFGGTPAYREAWAQFYGRRFGVELDSHTELVGLLGSKEGIFNLAMAYVNPGDVVLVPDPGYAPYATGATMAGGEVVYMPLRQENEFLPDLADLRRRPDLLRRAKLMWLNYPNNPTGAIASLEFFAEVIALAHEFGFLVAHDAPYTEITFDGYRAPSILQAPGARDVAVEFNSMSKAFNMGGWRVGVAVGNPDAIEALGMWKSNVDSGSFQPVLDASSAALNGDLTWLAARNEQYRERRDLVVAALRSAGLTVDVPKAAIYVWGRLPMGVDEGQYADELLETVGVSVTPGTVLGPSGAGYIRISLGTPTARVNEAMSRIVEWSRSRLGVVDRVSN